MKSHSLDHIITELDRYIDAADMMKDHMKQAGNADEQVKLYRHLSWDCFNALCDLKLARQRLEADAYTTERRKEVRLAAEHDEDDLGEPFELPEAQPLAPSYMGPPDDEDYDWSRMYRLAVDIVYGAEYSLPKLDSNKGWEEFHANAESA